MNLIQNSSNFGVRLEMTLGKQFNFFFSLAIASDYWWIGRWNCLDGCWSNTSCHCWPHCLHILGCKERPRLQFSWPIFTLCIALALGIYSYSGGYSFFLIISIFVFFFVLQNLNLWKKIKTQILFPMGRLGELVIGCIGALVFSGFIVYDTNNLIRRFNYDEYIEAACNLFLDVLNLFMYILMILNGDE